MKYLANFLLFILAVMATVPILFFILLLFALR